MTSFIRQILASLLGKKQAEDFLSGYIAKNSVQLFLLHCAALVLGFVSNYVLIRFAGVETYGSYVYIFNLIYLLAGFCIMGTDTLLVQKTAVYATAAEYPKLKGIILFALLVVIPASLLIAVVFQLLVNFAFIPLNNTGIDWLLPALVALVLLSVIAVNQSSLQGLKKIVFSQVSEKLVRPLLLIVLVIFFFYAKGHIRLSELIWLNIATIAVALLLTSYFHLKSLPVKIKTVKPAYETSRWISAAFTFFVLNGLNILNSRIDVFLLGLYKPKEEIGVYNIALRLGEVIGFTLVIVNFVLAPLIAGLYAAGEKDKLQKIITRSSRIIFIISFFFTLVIVLFRHAILAFFKVDFLDGSLALLILCLGQLVNVFFGSVGLLLAMTGHQKYSIAGLAAATALNIILNITLIPGYGLVGTAIAAAASLAAWNLLMYFFVRKKLDIKTTVFGVV